MASGLRIVITGDLMELHAALQRDKARMPGDSSLAALPRDYGERWEAEHQDS